MDVKTSPFIDSNYRLSATGEGSLARLTFAVKDVFEIAGHVASLGNPTWEKTHQPANQTAPSIQQLLKQGATLHGLTISDELMFSIKGLNIHYGAPLNPKHPKAFTGGSSSGSASAVARGIVDFALGTDTGGSIRVPASYCDLYGFRPTWQTGELPGVAPLAQTFDTVGLLARNPATLAKVGKIICPPTVKSLIPQKLIYFPSTFTRPSQRRWLHALKKISMIPVRSVTLPSKFNLEQLLVNFQQIQGYEAWHNYGSWLTTHHAHLAPDIAEHFQKARLFATFPSRYQTALVYRSMWADYIERLLADDAILVLPTTSTGPLPINSSEQIGEKIRHQTQLLTTLAGLSGCPQLVIPTSQEKGINSISFISAQNRDQSLLQLGKLLTNLVRGVILSKTFLLDSAG